ncbi:MAG: CocE/NonD family hydrolase, partial [Acidobacteriaceae bacterium]|nr:CocE/NonD family hydrolase [Acidobacteriaceae bacterium]
KRWSIEEHHPDIRVPALHVAAWYDIFLGGSIANYTGLKSRAGSAEARSGQHLLITIGGHAGSGQKIGAVDFGPNAKFDEDDVIIAWYDYLFKGAQNQFARKPVQLFLMGANEWRDEDDWPIPGARTTKYFLRSGGHANSSAGDGTLATNTGAGSQEPDAYRYDPSNPAPTVGGPLCCDSQHLKPGPQDQRTVEQRSDVLVYSTPVLQAPLEVIGPIRLELYAKSSAADTDFTAKLVDVAPDGFAQNLTEGIVRARYRSSQSAPELMKPDQVYKFSIDLWATGNVFRSGHRLRLEVSSSNFPRFDRNLNTAGSPESDAKYVTATNTVYHDAQHPSALLLPLVAP